MRDPRDEPNPHFCKDCGSTIYDKEWGLQHNQGCEFFSEELGEKLFIPAKPTMSPEIATDFFCYHG